MMAAEQPKKVLMLGGTRFIGVYLARMLVDQGHEVTLLTRGKSPVTAQIPDDTDEYYQSYAKSIQCTHDGSSPSPLPLSLFR